MENKKDISEFCNKISQMAEDDNLTAWDFYSALQEMCSIIGRSMRKHNEGKNLRKLGIEKWKVEYEYN